LSQWYRFWDIATWEETCSEGTILGHEQTKHAHEKDQNGRNSNARIQRSGEYVVVLRPPREMTFPDNVLEDEANDRPRNEIDCTGGGDISSPRKDDGETVG